MRTQHIILSCTNRKRDRSAARGVCLRDVPPGSLEVRAAGWIKAVSSAPTTHQVCDLYAGEYWRAGLDLARASAARGRTEVSVVSAGLGLVHSDDQVPTYSATFGAGQVDSVCDDREHSSTRRSWWSALMQWSGPSGVRSPRCLAQLADQPGSHLLVCVGPDYLDAVADDLREAHNILGSERLVVVSSSAPLENLADVWVRCPGQLRMRLGGSMASTGVRAARALVESSEDLSALVGGRGRDVVAKLLEDAAPLPTFDRKRMSDVEIRDWILTDIAAHPESATKSASILRLRQQGRACEQSRFGRLHDLVRADAR